MTANKSFGKGGDSPGDKKPTAHMVVTNVPLRLPEIIRRKSDGKLFINAEEMVDMVQQTTLVFSLAKCFLLASGVLNGKKGIKIETADGGSLPSDMGNQSVGDLMQILAEAVVKIATGEYPYDTPNSDDQGTHVIVSQMVQSIPEIMNGKTAVAFLKLKPDAKKDDGDHGNN